MNKYVLISAYFGNLPENFDLWLKSASRNTCVDFLLVSDADPLQFNAIPDNVKFLSMTFSELKTLFQSKFEFEIFLDKPYKLCDYKPAYGYIFQDHISDYEYWGHIDLDTILGDLTKFLPTEDYEKIYVYGHMCLYKNTAENNSRFMLDGGMDYRHVFTTDFNMIFDELPGMYKKFRLLDIPQYTSNDFADIARRRLNFTLNEKLCRKNYKYQIFYYENGGVFRDYYENGKINTDEFNYIHFSNRNIPNKTNGSENYYITRFGFLAKNSDTTLDIIKKLNGPTPIQNIYYYIKIQIIRRIKRIIKYLVKK